MKIAVSLFTLWLFVVLGFAGSFLSLDYLHTKLSMHHAYHKALQRSILSSSVENEFRSSFSSLAPKNLDYTIELVNFHEYPRLVSFRVKGRSKRNYVLVFEETLIEERRYE